MRKSIFDFIITTRSCLFIRFRLQLLVVFCFFLFSCNHKKNVVYFQGNQTGSVQNISYSPLLKPDDLLSIQVIGLEESSVRPFNLPVTSGSAVGGYSTGSITPPGYLIAADGTIDFPVVGKIKLSGLTRQEAIVLLKTVLKDYIQNPTIIMRILNYKVTVLGEVKNPGTFTIPNERITLLEAIGIAGDLQITALRNNILVLREVDGKLIETRVDLTKKDFFGSNVYYLQQNDVVYIEPNHAKINSGLINPANVGTGISLVSVLITLALFFSR